MEGDSGGGLFVQVEEVEASSLASLTRFRFQHLGEESWLTASITHQLVSELRESNRLGYCKLCAWTEPSAYKVF